MRGANLINWGCTYIAPVPGADCQERLLPSSQQDMTAGELKSDHPAFSGAGYGTITSLKSDFGFLHRDPKFGDGEVFFHYSEVPGGGDALKIGMDVEYSEMQQGADKLRAVDVTPLPAGYFDDVDSAVVTGTVSHSVLEAGKRKGPAEYVMARVGCLVYQQLVVKEDEFVDQPLVVKEDELVARE